MAQREVEQAEKAENEDRLVVTRLPWRRDWKATLLLLALALSLVLHFLTWLVIYRVRDLSREQLALLADQAQHAQSEVITVSIQLSEQVPVRADIPVDKQLSIPISTTVKIDQQIMVPLETPFGIYEIPVPIKLDVPVNLTVPVRLSETVAVSTTVELDIDTPLSISLSDTTLSDYLNQLREKLLALRDEL